MEVSVYDLITKLTEKHINKRKFSKQGVDLKAIIKKSRSKSFEILLKKQNTSEYTNELENNSDAICHLLAWHYRLRNELDQCEKAEALYDLINKLEETKFLDDPLAHNVILFLLYLRGSKPSNEKSRTSDIFNKVTLKNKSSNKAHALEYDVFPQYTFILPKNSYSDDDRSLKSYSSKIFTLEPKLNLKVSNSSSKFSLRNVEKVSSYKMDFKFDTIITSTKRKCSKIFCIDSVADEGYVSPPSVKKAIPQDIWDVASKLPINNFRTWESLDNWEPVKELPFACESGPKTLHFLNRIINANTPAILENKFIEENIILTVDFVKCLKFMLVGMTSDIFSTNDGDLFFLKKATTVEGLSHEALQSYCKDLMFCGSSYRALSKLCSSSSYTSNEKHGYVFKELSEAIKRYLIFYRVAAVSVPDTATLLTVHAHVRPLMGQINTFARICKVAYYEGGAVPQGAELLNYIYQEIINAVDNSIALVLYSAFYPCCQIYFSRFLQRWLFEGVLIDPYEEFIIKSDSNYNKARARIYWSKAFSLRHSYVPEFLSDLKSDILQCGKTMNLLKLCNPDASLYTHIMSRSVPLISCCLTLDHSVKLNQEIECYYIEMASLCGPRISLYHNLRDRYGYEDNIAFASLVEKKRALSYREMELRKQYEAEEKAKNKRKIFEEMQEQMRLASEDKRKAKEEELQRDLLIAKQCAQIEEMRSQLVKEESKAIINYYDNLIEAVDKRRQSFEMRKQKLLDTSLDELLQETDLNKNCDTKSDDTSSDDLFLSPKSTLSQLTDKNVESNSHFEIAQDDVDVKKNVDNVENLDTVNANIEMYNQMNENNLAAQRNRAKVLNLEFDLTINAETIKAPTMSAKKATANMSEAQRNKLRVLSSEFDLFYDTQSTDTAATNEAPVNFIENENNGNILLAKQQPAILLTNENSDSSNSTSNTNNNLASPGHEDVMNLVHRKKSLKLKTKHSELLPILEKPKGDIIPMSIDSTPNTEYCASDLQTPSSAKLSLNTDINLDTASIIDSEILTSQITDEHGFKFPTNDNNKKFTYDNTGYKLLFAGKRKIFSITENVPKRVQPMRISKEEVDAIKKGNLKFLLYQSVSIPLEAQMKLVNSEILKYFINEQNYFSHLHSLRSYYFIMDGEFGRGITEGLFTKLYESKNPADLLNLRSLQAVIEQALYASSKVQENGDRLSFIVKNIPKTFDLSNADVFDCLTLSYQINWPLNILLPFDTIEKYDLVFKYLLKLQYVSWILQKIFQDLKNSRKEYGIDENLLSNSPQYHRIQLYRHIMSHFVVTLQSYTVSEVLQTSWEELENNLKSVTTLDQLYNVHILYLKTTIFRCLLNKKCAPIMKVIREIFVVILKFYNYLRSRSWNLKESDFYYTHPNFRKLEDIFNKFQEFTNFVFRVGNKMARVGYQPHLIQMLDMLNTNEYYTSKRNV